MVAEFSSEAVLNPNAKGANLLVRVFQKHNTLKIPKQISNLKSTDI